MSEHYYSDDSDDEENGGFELFPNKQAIQAIPAFPTQPAQPVQPSWPEKVYKIKSKNGLNSNIGKNFNEKKKEFDGSISVKYGWIKCFYCDRYHPNSMHLTGMNYCGHCWGWLNSDQVKLTEGKYLGQDNNINEIKNFLKLTYPLHSNSCTNTECIYNKITAYKNNGTLHFDFSIELGFIKKEEKDINLSNSNKTYINSQHKINKKSNLRINFNASSISI